MLQKMLLSNQSVKENVWDRRFFVSVVAFKTEFMLFWCGLFPSRIREKRLITAHQRSCEGYVFSRVCPLVLLFALRGAAGQCTWPQTRTPAPVPSVQDMYMFKLVQYWTGTVWKRTVGIWLKCLLVLYPISFNQFIKIHSMKPVRLQGLRPWN